MHSAELGLRLVLMHNCRMRHRRKLNTYYLSLTIVYFLCKYSHSPFT